MANLALTNATIWSHDTDLSAALNVVRLKAGVAELDATTFGSTYRVRKGGLKTVEADISGYWDSAPDLARFGALGVQNRAWTISPEGAETKVAYLFQGADFAYEQFGEIGQMAPFRASAKNSASIGGLVRGQMAKANGNVSAVGALGSGLNLGAVGATQFLYATFHVFAAGTTITVQIQSDTTGAFAAPTVRGTIGPVTVAGGTWLTRVAGPITDTWWRLNVSAITGTFAVAGAIGIGS